LESYWPGALYRTLAEQPCVLVTVISVKGSAPRAVGARMIITAEGQAGSIGGGNLEFQATGAAREMLRVASEARAENRPYGLGPALNQCCGGAVTLLFECLLTQHTPWLEALQDAKCRSGAATLVTALDRNTVSKWLLFHPGADEARVPHEVPHEVPPEVLQAALAYRAEPGDAPVLLSLGGQRYLLEAPRDQRIPLAMFGAGHVATALADILRQMPVDLVWIDSRAEQFPAWARDVGRVVVAADPVNEVAGLAPGSCYLVMTHSHELDEDLCHAILERGDAAWLGLIGSASKRRRFVHRLGQRGLNEPQLQRLVCPVGMAGISGKRPATIALAIAAQLLQEQVPEGWR
jgi:xanthine dehydrogenase accessory factor